MTKAMLKSPDGTRRVYELRHHGLPYMSLWEE